MRADAGAAVAPARRTGDGVNTNKNELPAESFGELVIELRRIAGEEAAAVGRCEEAVARIEAGASALIGEPVNYEGLRFALSIQRQRAAAAGSLYRIFESLIPLEREVRALHAAKRMPPC